MLTLSKFVLVETINPAARPLSVAACRTKGRGLPPSHGWEAVDFAHPCPYKGVGDSSPLALARCPMLFPEAVDLAALIEPRREATDSDPTYLEVFVDGSFTCTTDASCWKAERISRKVRRWHRKGRYRKLAQFFGVTRDVITGL